MRSSRARSGSCKNTITPFLLSSGSSDNRAGDQSKTGDSGSQTHESHTSSSQPSPDLSRSASARGARPSSSILPNLRLAGLVVDRDMRSSRSRESTPKPKPLLILKLSGSSFLDSVIRDDKNKDPLYILETSNEVTSIYRLDHPRDEPVKAATIQWPLHPVRTKGKSGRSVQFGNGSWRESEDVLKSGPLGNTAIRKFNLPHYPHSLKWKLIPGNCFCCVTNAVKGPVAVLDAATLSAPPRLKIYDALIERDVVRSQDNYKGVPTILIDYLMVTALLLVTDVQEWLDRPRESHIPGSSSYTVQRWLALIHNKPAPLEPDYPTVDLSLMVPSTPPQSATIPSPGGFWETQSGITSLSGSNGSGSGASYNGEPFTPTTPATPATPATSAHSSAFFSHSLEDTPPVPPIPSTSSGPSPFAYNVESMRARERPKSNPQTLSHSPHSSTSTAQVPDSDYSAALRTECDEEPASPPRTRPPQTRSLPAGVQGAPSLLPTPGSSSTSAPSSPGPILTGSLRAPRRQLPTPPGPMPVNSFAQPWLYPSNPSPSTSISAASSSTSVSPTTPLTPGMNAASRAARASMRGTLRTSAIPPPPPPPQHSIPLPPKLAREQQGYVERAASRPRTAPESENMGRRRHSAGAFPDYLLPEEESLSVHPYAAAASSPISRGGEVEGHDMRALTGQMREMSTPSMSGSSSRASHMAHVRAPSQPAPDYDTHSFVNVPPSTTSSSVLPGSSGMAAVRSPLASGRRVLAVVNGDARSISSELCPLSDRDLRLRSRMSYAESIYEAPPPAYDAIDFSVPAVPPRPAPLQQPMLQLTPLPVPPVEGGSESYRAS